jgi:hypothetical protein
MLDTEHTKRINQLERERENLFAFVAQVVSLTRRDLTTEGKDGQIHEQCRRIMAERVWMSSKVAEFLAGHDHEQREST